MNENLNLVEILKDCPEGTKLYSPVFGEVEFESINDIIGPIVVTTNTGNAECFTADGKMYTRYNGECLLFPSKEQRDWSKFNVKKKKIDTICDKKTAENFGIDYMDINDFVKI